MTKTCNMRAADVSAAGAYRRLKVWLQAMIDSNTETDLAARTLARMHAEMGDLMSNLHRGEKLDYQPRI